MRILCTNQALGGRGGSESYLEALVPALHQLGHDVELYSPRVGPVAERFRTAGFVVHSDDRELRTDYDVVHAQDAPTAMLARARLPATPIVFAAHSWFLHLVDPPAEAAPSAVVVFNDLVAARARASVLGDQVPIHRLTQPITLGTADRHRVGIRARPTRALAMSRNLSTRIGPLHEACAATGISLQAFGRDDELEHPELEMVRTDVVIGSGRTILEALAVGRAAFVYDETGCAGYVTPDSYPSLEACGFTPDAGEPVMDLAAQLRRYDQSLGTVGRELAVRHHAVAHHAAALVEIYRSTPEPDRPPAPPEVLRRLAVLAQRAFDAENRARSTMWQMARAEQELQDLEDRLDVVQTELHRVWATASWRATAPLRWLSRRSRRWGRHPLPPRFDERPWGPDE